ncbi:hypothetical protein PG996_011760 [Apiospora saccharicola]|uniref:Uncharacterized protein n=1 Tax=Apiospora saccharicola TaxID=335842 RepID=A0ABR1UFZ9_9PEZI
MESAQGKEQWPPVAIIGLVSLLATVVLAPIGWFIHRHSTLHGSNSGFDQQAAAEQANNVELGPTPRASNSGTKEQATTEHVGVEH